MSWSQLMQSSSRPVRLPADRSSPARAREFVHESLEGLAPEVVDDAELLVSELVTNAVLHARTPLEVNIHVGAGEVRVEVHDDSDVLPVARISSDASVGGRGLQLVERVARSWGIERRNRGKVVWFELATNPR